MLKILRFLKKIYLMNRESPTNSYKKECSDLKGKSYEVLDLMG